MSLLRTSWLCTGNIYHYKYTRCVHSSECAGALTCGDIWRSYCAVLWASQRPQQRPELGSCSRCCNATLELPLTIHHINEQAVWCLIVFFPCVCLSVSPATSYGCVPIQMGSANQRTRCRDVAKGKGSQTEDVNSQHWPEDM